MQLKRMKQRIHAILTDYDGTLVPTANVKNPEASTVARELEQTLEKVSIDIPICIISTKDFNFLKNKTAFARILSCMVGIETLVLANDASSRIIEKRLLFADRAILRTNSRVLEAISEAILSYEDFLDMVVERKHTSDGILAGLTIDWRHLPSDDWSYYRRGITRFISSIVTNLRKPSIPVDIYVQEYSTHPFVDIYSTESNKGMAFDTVIAELGYSASDCEGILYLGDSENDNPAFRRAGISIGIRSDARVNPKLDCSYFLNYEQLSSFLMKLRNNDYLFNDELLLEKPYE